MLLLKDMTLDRQSCPVVLFFMCFRIQNQTIAQLTSGEVRNSPIKGSISLAATRPLTLGARRHRAAGERKQMCVTDVPSVAAPQENDMTVPQGKTGLAFVLAKLITKEDP